jgi:SAM-dependent methyltransferase
MSEDLLNTIRYDYDRVAAQYAVNFLHELQSKPLDRELLLRFASLTAGKGQVCDMGCGPGHVARFLREAGAPVFGIDLSPQMVEQARRLNPEIPFHEGNMLSLDLPDGKLAGIAAYYAIVNLPTEFLPTAFREMARFLQPGGVLLLAFHIGDYAVRPQELLGIPISMEFFFFEPSAVEFALREAGFTIEETHERAPYAPEVEYQSHRAYIFARKPVLPMV